MSSFSLRGVRWIDVEAGAVTPIDLTVDAGRVTRVSPSEVTDGPLLGPGLVELHGRLVDLGRDGEAALRGGFTTVLLSAAQPRAFDDAAFARAHLARARTEAPVRVEVAGAATVGLRGEELSEMGTLVAAGCAALSNGPELIGDTRALRSIFEYSSRFHVPLLLRAGDVSLERGAVAAEGRRALRLGLPSVPSESEEIGVCTVAAMVRRTGRAVHLTHLWSAAGVAAVRRARAEGLPITASTTAHHLAVDDVLLERLAYAGTSVFRPPLGDDADRAALRSAVLAGELCVAADHTPVPPYLQDVEMQAATPGAIGFETAASLVWSALGDPLAWAWALAGGPGAVLGRRPVRLVVGEACPDLVWFDPDHAWTVVGAATAASHRNQPLDGQRLTGRVAGVVVRGELRSFAAEHAAST